MARLWFGIAVAFAVACLAACSRPPTLLVTVAAIPAEAKSLAAFITKQGDDGRAVSSMAELVPYDLPTPSPNTLSFVLRLELEVAAQLTVSVASFSETGATGCLLAIGSAGHPFQLSTLDDVVTVPLEKLTAGADNSCMGASRVVSASPAMLRAAGGDKLIVKGWGFRPESQIILNGVALSTKYVSAGQLEATVPPSPSIGPVVVQVQTGAQKSAAWNGLRYIAESILFEPLSLTPLLTGVVGAQVGDLNGDGKLDLAFAPFDPLADKITIALQGNDLKFTIRRVTVTTGLKGLFVADVDRDGDLDIVTASEDDDELSVLMNDGSASFNVARYALSFKPLAFTSADINGDGAIDALFLDDLQSTVYTLVNDGSGKYLTEDETSLDNGAPPNVITSLDYDLDGKPDVVIDNVDDNMGIFRAVALLNEGTALPADDENASVISFNAQPVAPFLNRDLDGDGKPDLLIPVTGEVLHLYPSASGAPRPERRIQPPCSPGWVGSGDLDGDGRLDLAVACADDTQIGFMRQGEGLTFSTLQQAPAVNVPTPVMAPLLESQLVDLDGDGKPELLTGDGNYFHVYHNISR